MISAAAKSRQRDIGCGHEPERVVAHKGNVDENREDREEKYDCGYKGNAEEVWQFARFIAPLDDLILAPVILGFVTLRRSNIVVVRLAELRSLNRCPVYNYRTNYRPNKYH